MKKFQQYCEHQGVRPLPADPTTVVNFLGFIKTQGLSAATARTYVAALGNQHKESNFESPTARSIVKAALRGYGKLKPQKPDTRLPITINIMRQIKTFIASSDLCYYDQRMLWFSFCLAFFGFLRVGEFTTPTSTYFDPERCLRFRDVYVSPNGSHLTVIIRASKTDQHAQGHQVVIPATNRSVCAVKACRKFFAILSSLNPELDEIPLLQFSNKQFLTRSSFQKHLRSFLRGIPDSRRYSTHSFRIGAATAAAQKGHEADSIKRAGRWKSTAYQGYIRTVAMCPKLY